MDVIARVFISVIFFSPIFYGLWMLYDTRPFLVALIAGGLVGLYHHLVLYAIGKHTKRVQDHVDLVDAALQAVSGKTPYELMRMIDENSPAE